MYWNVDLETFQNSFFASQARFPAFVAGWGTGKTMCAILKVMELSINYPKNQGVVLRKNYTDLKDSTMSDFSRYTGIKIRSDKTVTLKNGSKILFHHADELAGVIQNINLGWFFIEQAEEFDNEEVFQKLRGRLRREGVPHQGLIIANTNGHNWIWRLWRNSTLDNFELTEATTFDNKRNLPDDFLKDLKNMEIESPSHYRRYVLNSWEDTDTADKVIPYQKILDSVDRDLRDYDTDTTVISCDPAEYGDDKTVIYVFKGLKIIDKKITSKRSLMETAGEVMRFYHECHADRIVVDDIGVGAGVRARLRELNAPVLGINTGRASEDRVRYNRLRDQIWMHASHLFKEDYVSIPNDNDLIEDLAAFTYSMNSKGQIMVARKKDIKKILNRSPDRADALVLGLWGAKKTKRRISVPVGSYEEEYNPLTFEL